MDPFFLDAPRGLPDVLFSGGVGATFGTRLVRGGGAARKSDAAASSSSSSSSEDADRRRIVRVITVPDFSKTQSVVLVNIRSPTLEAHLVSFATMS